MVKTTHTGTPAKIESRFGGGNAPSFEVVVQLCVSYQVDNGFHVFVQFCIQT